MDAKSVPAHRLQLSQYVVRVLASLRDLHARREHHLARRELAAWRLAELQDLGDGHAAEEVCAAHARVSGPVSGQQFASTLPYMLSCLSLLTFTHGVEVSVFGPSVSSVAGILFCSSMLAVRVAVRALPSEYEAVH